MMDTPRSTQAEGTKALTLVTWLADHAIDGVRPLSSAQDLAAGYLRNQKYRTHRQRIDALIKWETTKNFTSGFVTGLGGLLTLPVALPAGFAASWVIQARMAAAIARIYGHDLRSERIRTLIVGTLVGDSIAEIAAASGIRIGGGIAKTMADKVSRRGVIDFSRRIGARLLAKAGQKSSVNLMKGVPLFGGLAGGTLDAVACRIVGKHARRLFEITEGTEPEAESPPPSAHSGGDRTGAAKTTRARAARKSPAKKTSAGKSSGKKSSARKSGAGRKSPRSTRARSGGGPAADDPATS